MQENSAAEGQAWVQDRTLLALHSYLSICLDTPKILVIHGRAQLEHSCHIIISKVITVEATQLHFNPWHILKETIKPAGPFGTMCTQQ